MTVGDCMHTPVEPEILPVHVVENVGVEEDMIECGVEDDRLVGGSSAYLNGIQTSIPGGIGVFGKFREVEARILISEIQLGIFDADKRDTDLNTDGVI